MKKAFLFMLLCVVTSPLYATTYYVANQASGASDAHNCTDDTTNACKTITRGLAVSMGAGNKLIVEGSGAADPYTETANITTGGSSGSPFVLQGYNAGSCPETPSSDPLTPLGTNPAPTVQVVGQIQVNASNVTVTCIEVTPNPALGINYNYNGYDPTHAGIGVSTMGLSNIVISENYIHKNTSGAGGGFGAIDPTGSGHYVFNYAIAAGSAGLHYGLTNITVTHNFDHMGGGGGGISISCAGLCNVTNNEEYGGEQDDNIYEGPDLDYNEVENGGGVGGGVLTFHFNYMHGADQNFCGTTRHNCHTDCVEDSDWNLQNAVIDGNICFNQDEGIYLWDCPDSNCNTSGMTYWVYGTYYLIFNVRISNNLIAFGPNIGHLDVGIDIWHGQASVYNNAVWGAYSEAQLNSDIQYWENNILYQTYLGLNGDQCTTPYGINLEGQPISGGDSTTFDNNNKNIDYQDTTCSVPHTGLYANDLVNVNPLWVAPGTYSNTPGAVSPNINLQSGSPAIAAGINLALIFTNDLFNKTRNAGAAYDIGPVAFASSQPGISFNPTSLSFGVQLDGTTSPVMTVTVTNTGTAVLNFSSIYLVGINAGEFGVTTTCGPTLGVGVSCVLQVTFAPITPGGKSADVQVTDNAPNSPQLVPLSGIGGTSTLTFPSWNPGVISMTELIIK